VSAVVLKELKEKGIELAPGESIEYILVKNYSRKGQTSELPQAKSYQGYAVGDEYNVDEYGKLLLKAGEMLLLPFGYDWKKLAELFQMGDNKKLLKKNEIKLIEDAGTGKWMIDTAA
jgi:DNA polymerase elongation subunit (family B)